MSKQIPFLNILPRLGETAEAMSLEELECIRDEAVAMSQDTTTGIHEHLMGIAEFCEQKIKIRRKYC